jgi:hypothetical protein
VLNGNRVRDPNVQIFVVRDEAVAPGGESWMMLPGEVVCVVSAQGVTEVGAEALEVALGDFVDRGVWIGCEVNGEPVRMRVYHTTHVDHLLSPPAPVVMVAHGALVKVYMSASHFAPESATALEAVGVDYGAARVEGRLPEVEVTEIAA